MAGRPRAVPIPLQTRQVIDRTVAERPREIGTVLIEHKLNLPR
jgi:hypothetical protein